MTTAQKIALARAELEDAEQRLCTGRNLSADAFDAALAPYEAAYAAAIAEGVREAATPVLLGLFA